MQPLSHLDSIDRRAWNASKTEQAIRKGFAAMLERIPAQSALRALSVSCGDGSWDYLVARSGKPIADIVATDIVDCPVSDDDRQTLERLCQWSFVKVEPERPLPFPDASFDLVFHQDVVEHVRRPFLFLSEQRRVLKEGGHLLFGTPNLLRPANVAKLLAGRLRFPVRIGGNVEIGDYIHIQEFTEWQLQTMVEEQGFEVLELLHCFWGLHFLGLQFSPFPRSRLGASLCHHMNLLARRGP